MRAGERPARNSPETSLLLRGGGGEARDFPQVVSTKCFSAQGCFRIPESHTKYLVLSWVSPYSSQATSSPEFS